MQYHGCSSVLQHSYGKNYRLPNATYTIADGIHTVARITMILPKYLKQEVNYDSEGEIEIAKMVVYRVLIHHNSSSQYAVFSRQQYRLHPPRHHAAVE